MSEPVLKAIMRLFALVAKEDKVTQQERDYIRNFLADHLNQKAVASHVQLFDDYSSSYSGKLSVTQEQETIDLICAEINQEVVQKQKAVIILELMTIILADGTISMHEELLSHAIGKALLVSKEDVNLIQAYVQARTPQAFDHESILIIESQPSPATRSKKIIREDLDGFIAVLYVKSTDIYFIKYLGKTDVYLNGVPLKPGSIMVLATGSALRWETADPVYYGDVLSCFKKITSRTHFSFEAKNIFYQFKNGKLGLREVNIAEQSGKLIALMGASGAGK